MRNRIPSRCICRSSSRPRINSCRHLYRKWPSNNQASKVLAATGRKPSTASLGLENTDVKLTDRGAIAVDEYLRTDADNIWAIGDVKGGLQFTYISLDDYRIIMDQLKGENKRTTNNRKAVPYSVFITPTLSM